MARIITQSKVTTKGQVTVPEPVRAQLRLEAGDRLDWEPQPDGSFNVRKVRGKLSDLVGMLGTPASSATLEEMDKGIADYLRDKHRARR